MKVNRIPLGDLPSAVSAVSLLHSDCLFFRRLVATTGRGVGTPPLSAVIRSEPPPRTPVSPPLQTLGLGGPSGYLI